MLNITPIKKHSVSDDLAEQLREAIMAGDLLPGDSLPAERKLAEQFSVNRSSVREALRRLESWGLVEVQHGSGVRVADLLAGAGLHILPFMLRPRGKLDTALLGDLCDLRAELLGWTAERAAQGADAKSIDALAEILDAIDQADDVDTLQTLDYRFFEQLVAMSHNRILLLLANVVREVYASHLDLFRLLYQQDFSSQWHHKALNAIRRGQTEAARKAMNAYGLIAVKLLSQAEGRDART